MEIKLAADCSANICQNLTLPVSYVPLKIVTQEKEYTDTHALDVPAMLRELKEYKGTSSTACPGIQDWLDAFGDADMVLGASITSALSGCYNAAAIAAREYMEKNPGAKVFIFDSLSTGPELELLLEHYAALVKQNLDFDAICDGIRQYSRHTHLVFSLSSVDNLVKNGRVNPLVGKAVGILGLRIVGRASDEGTLKPMHKCRGEKKSLSQMLDSMQELGYRGGKVRLSHSYNEATAKALAELILAQYPQADITITCKRGLCCYSAEEGGLLAGFEDI